jgi:hypothetical protein
VSSKFEGLGPVRKTRMSGAPIRPGRTRNCRELWGLATIGVGLMVLLSLGPGGIPSPALNPGPSPSGGSHTPVPVTVDSHTFLTPIRHVFVILMENANASWVLQNGTYESYLAHRYAYAADFYSLRHGSTPDYFAVTSGTLKSQLVTYNLTNVATLIEKAGLTWGDFQQSIPHACDRATNVSRTFPYAPGHDPFVFYEDVVSNSTYCDKHVTGFGKLDGDLLNGTVPNYAFVVANEYNDSHNLCPPFYSWETNVSCGDRWLQGWLSPILSSGASWVSSSAFLILYDEANQTDTRGIDNTTGGGVVYMTVAGPCARAGYVSTQAYTDYNVLTTTEWLLNLGSLDRNDSWTEYPPMTSMFNFTACTSSTTSLWRVYGRVVNQSLDPIAGALVSTVVGGTVKSTKTGSHGYFSLALPNGTYVLTISAVGYKTKNVTVTVAGTSVKVGRIILDKTTSTLLQGPGERAFGGKEGSFLDRPRTLGRVL